MLWLDRHFGLVSIYQNLFSVVAEFMARCAKRRLWEWETEYRVVCYWLTNMQSFSYIARFLVKQTCIVHSVARAERIPHFTISFAAITSCGYFWRLTSCSEYSRNGLCRRCHRRHCSTSAKVNRDEAGGSQISTTVIWKRQRKASAGVSP